MQWAKFLAAIAPDLIALARELFSKHSGNVEAARVELRNIHSQRAGIEADRLKVDAEIAERKARQAIKSP